MANLSNINNKFLVTTGGNVGINTTSPDSKLDVTGGDITVNTTGTGFMNFKYSNSSKGTIGTDGIDLKITAAADLQLLPTGNVGIGTSSPASLLHIQGSTYNRVQTYFDGDYTSGFKFSDLNGGIWYDAGADDLILNSGHANSQMIFNTGGSESVRITSAGRVGIGTTSPDNILHIRNGDTTYASQVGADTMLFLETTNISNALQFTSANTGQQYIMFGDDDPNAGWISYNHSDNNLNFRVNGSERMRIDSSGRVGIGTTSPSNKLDVKISTANRTTLEPVMSVSAEGSGPYTGFGPKISFSSNIYYGAATGNPAGIIETAYIGAVMGTTYATNSDLVFATRDGATSVNEKMRILGNGNIGIGTTSPQRELHLHTSSSGGSFIAFTNDTTGQTSTDGAIVGIDSSEDLRILQYENKPIRFSTNGSERMRIDSSGNVGIGVVPNAVTAGNIRLDVGYVGCGITSRQNAELVLTSNADYVTATTTGRNAIMINLQNDGNFNILNAPSTTAGSALTFTSRFYINTSGNVGISTTSPNKKLEILSTASDHLRLAYNSSAYWDLFQNAADGSFRILKDNGSLFTFSQSGDLGIGTDSPSYSLDVKGPDTNNAVIARFYSNISARGSFIIRNGSGTNPTTFIGTAGGSEQLSIGTNSTEAIRIDGSGRVGIGTDSPSVLLDTRLSGTTGKIAEFHNSVGYGIGFTVESDGGVNTINSESNQALAFATNGTSSERMRIDSSGRVGIGTPTPSAKLHVHATSGDGFVRITGDNIINSGGAIKGFNNGLAFNVAPSGGGSDIEAIRIQGNGNVGIGNTSPQTTLHTGPTTTITNVFTARFAASNFFASGGNSMFYVPDTAANIMMFGSNQFGTNQIEFYHKNPGTSQAYVGRISTSSSATSYVTSSDYRLKENIVPISDSISRLNQLKPSRFNFIEEPGKIVDGFIAHEVQDIVPEAIVGEKDEVDEDGGIIPQGIDQAKLVPLLVAAMQELEARVKELENK